jgi:hypothetical protein
MTPPSRHPLQNIDLESLSAGQLFELFAAWQKSRAIPVQYLDLASAWGLLFSAVFLSADELVDAMEKGEYALGEERDGILREFIRDDCRSGGSVVIEMIRKGGHMDRAALIMIADPVDLGGLVNGGTTALHLLAEACDRTLRPALIRRAGKSGLAAMYDGRGLPVIFTILALNDLRKDDLNAIGQVFTRDELAHEKNKNRTGRSALDVYSEASQRLKGQVPGERNAFMVSRAVKSTRLRPEQKPQGRTGRQRPGADVMGENRPGDEEDQAAGGQYGDLITQPLDRLGLPGRRRPGRK